MIDTLSRLVSDHLNLLSGDETVVKAVIEYFISIMDYCTCYNYNNLITESIHEFFSLNSQVPSSVADLVPTIIQSLVQRSLLPPECFEAGSIEPYEEKEVLIKFRHSCQDVLLEMASSSIGVYQTATSLFAISFKDPQNLPLQEAVLCLFCGIIDSIEEQLLPLFQNEEFYQSEETSRLFKRTDISSTPLITKYDTILDYVFQHMQEYTVHPLLLSTALQVMFSFDNWTFSRGEYCNSLFQYLLVSIPSAPISLIPRLLRYISRLYESPCFHVSKEIVQQLIELSNHIHSLNNVEILTVFVQTVSTSISSLLPDEALIMYGTVFQPYLDTLLQVHTTCQKGIALSQDQVIQVKTCLHCLTALFDGCLVDSLASQFGSTLLPILFEATQTYRCSTTNDPDITVVLLASKLLYSIVKAADLELKSEDAETILRFCAITLQDMRFMEGVLEIVDALMNCVNHLNSSCIEGVHSLVKSTMRSILEHHAIHSYLDSVKHILRIECVLLKENTNKNACAAESTIEMLTAIIQEQVNEEELIRLILKFFPVLLQVHFYLLF